MQPSQEAEHVVQGMGSYVWLFAVLLAVTLGMTGCRPVQPVNAMPPRSEVPAEQAVVARFYEEVIN
jgi:hypothetical protein